LSALPQEIIRRKRDGEVLRKEEIDQIVAGLSDGSLSEGQVAAFAMAVFLRGMSGDECVALTHAMTASGEVLDWSRHPLGGPILDKHSTGGVGDKVSLMLAPMVAAAGGFVPMISGRGLGHTGGTLDKLESIPGYTTSPDIARFQKVVRDVGCAIIGQTPELAPADRRFYAIRDVTATVESVPLITASILSKKLAAGLNGLVMDIKCGSGAFADNPAMARELAESIVRVAGGAGLPTAALITDMNQVLGRSAGNAVELAETVDYLTGSARDPRLHEVVLELGARMLCLGGLQPTLDGARARLEAVLSSGEAADRFGTMVASLGGPGDFLDRATRYLPAAPSVEPVAAAQEGFVEAMDVRGIGLTIIELGGGRRLASDRIDHRVGLSGIVQVGETVMRGDPLAWVHAASPESAKQAAERVRSLMRIAPGAPEALPVSIDAIDSGARGNR
jgi:thymidine phosphorylase